MLSRVLVNSDQPTCDKLWYFAGQHEDEAELAPGVGYLHGGGVEARVVASVESPAPGQGGDWDQAAGAGEVDEVQCGGCAGLGEPGLQTFVSDQTR